MPENDPFLKHVDQIRRELTRYGVVQLEVDYKAERVRLSIDGDCDTRHRFETVIEASLENEGTLEVRGAEQLLQPFSGIARNLVALGVSNASTLERMVEDVRYMAHLAPAQSQRCR